MQITHIFFLASLLGLTLLTLPVRASDTATTDTSDTSNIIHVVTNQQTIVVSDDNDEEPPVAVTLSDDRETAQSKDILTFRAAIHNPKDEDINEVKITAHIPDYLTPVATSPTAHISGIQRTLTWENQTISAGADVTFAFKVRVEEIVPSNHLLRTIVDINGPGVHGSATDLTQVTGLAPATVSVVATPAPKTIHVPVTAKTGTSLPLAASSLILGLLLSTSARRNYR